MPKKGKPMPQSESVSPTQNWNQPSTQSAVSWNKPLRTQKDS